MAATVDPITSGVLNRLSVAPGSIQYVTPQLLTFLRGLGWDVSSLESARTTGLAGVSAEEVTSKAKLGVQAERERRATAGDVLRRGVAGGGEGTRALAEQQQNEGFRMTDLETALGAKRAGIQTAYDTGISNLRRGALETILSSDTQQSIAEAQQAAQTAAANNVAGAYKTYTDQLIAQQKWIQGMYANAANPPAAAAAPASPGAKPTITYTGEGQPPGTLPEFNIDNFRLSDYPTVNPRLGPTVAPKKPKTPGFTYGAPQLLRGGPY